MNQQCKVCGEPAAGFHFGAFTCEGCKSFFGRTYNNLSSITECKNHGECVINKKNRTACKACRLRKCLLVGMSKSGSRYGRRSNWFKIHCLLQEQQQKNSSNSTSGGSPGSFLSNNFLPSHFLSNLCNNNKQESQRTFSSPSDSGASSADLEDSNTKDRSMENSSIESKTEKSSICSIKTESFLTKDERITPFYTSRCHSDSYLQIAPITLQSVIQPINIIPPAVKEQDEPIDLSLKSRQRNSLPLTTPTTLIDTISSKPVPLDLTLVRGQSLLG